MREKEKMLNINTIKLNMLDVQVNALSISWELLQLQINIEDLIKMTDKNYPLSGLRISGEQKTFTIVGSQVKRKIR